MSYDAWSIIEDITSHCSTQPEYLLPNTSFKESVFRLLLAEGPMDAARISERLKDHGRRVFPLDSMRKVLESCKPYCIVPVSEQDIQELLRGVENRHEVVADILRAEYTTKAVEIKPALPQGPHCHK